MLTPATLRDLQRALEEERLDGWLLFDFRGINPIAAGLLQLEGMVTRRVFAYIPRQGVPTAITHAIEQLPWQRWPAQWKREIYSSWRSLESLLAGLVRGKRVAMEYSPGDAVPYVDRIPAGVLEMVRAAGADVVTSGELISRFYAVWSADDLASHRRSAETIAALAREALRLAGERAGAGQPLAEHEIMRWLREGFDRAGLETDHGPNVSAGANAANPHYEPSPEHERLVKRGDILLIDLWAREPGRPYADQTWMASLGPPSDRAAEIWRAIRDGRDAAIAMVKERAARGETPRGGDIDDAARRVIAERGFGDQFVHRTGHSIDARDIHGSGPHLDNLETREERLLIPGVGFSIEPGIYIPGEIGMRTEVNACIQPGEAVITPTDYQHELAIV